MTDHAIAPGQRIHHWQIIAIDGRRVTAQCRCRQVRIIAVEDLLSGVRTSCGCAPSPPAHNRAVREAREERQRQRLHDWHPERGR